MLIRQRNPLSTMDEILSGDPVLSHVTALFAVPASPAELAERPARPVASKRTGALRDALSTPEFFAVAAVALLVACALLGGLLNSAAIALGGLAAPLLLGIGCYVAIKRRQPARPTGTRTGL